MKQHSLLDGHQSRAVNLKCPPCTCVLRNPPCSFGKHSAIMKSSLPLYLRRKVCNQLRIRNLEPHKSVRKGTSTERGMERKMSSAIRTGRKRVFRIRERTQVRNILVMIKKEYWTSAGHVMPRIDSTGRKTIVTG